MCPSTLEIYTGRQVHMQVPEIKLRAHIHAYNTCDTQTQFCQVTYEQYTADKIIRNTTYMTVRHRIAIYIALARLRMGQ